jgi:hypothetical protein
MENAARDMWYFLKGIELPVDKCEKCVEIKGDCIELFHFCHLKKLVRSENFVPYHVLLKSGLFLLK